LLVALAFVTALMTPAHAQRLEITPFGGFRGGGAISTVNGAAVAGGPNGASAGVLVDVVFGPLNDGIKVEGLFSRQRSNLHYRRSTLDPPGVASVTVDHLLVGGVYDLSPGRVQPFLSGGVGLSRIGTPDVTTVNFAVAGGAGAKFFANRHIGARFDGRVYVTILDATASGVCGGGCVIGFRVSPSAQVEFTAGLVLAF
jgi:hypothetical protein